MLLPALLLLAAALSSHRSAVARLAHDYASRGDGLVRLQVRPSGEPGPPPPRDRVTLVRRLPRQATPDDEGCECIEYYLCVNGTIDPAGGDAIDRRLGEPCPAPQVCCRPPPGAATPQPEPMLEDPGCGIQRADANAVDGLYSRIHDVDDREAYFGEFPWMLALLLDGTFLCGASLVHKQVALTAAHCVNSSMARRLVVRAGEWDPTTQNEPEPYQEVGVRRVVQHPRFYDHGLYHDVALLELERPLEEGRSVGLVCVASSPDEYDATRCMASGWGTDDQGMKTEPFTTALRRVELPIVPREECQHKLRLTRLSKYFMLHKSFMCSGGKPGKDTCKGDGGGPLVCPLKELTTPRYVQVGIVAWGVGCGDRDVPAVYADVAHHADWISEQLHAMGHQIGSFRFEDCVDQPSP